MEDTLRQMDLGEDFPENTGVRWMLRALILRRLSVP